jgi:signal transduction histidine kinase
MFKSLRGRFILSHMLPLVVVIPLIGVTLVYVLETQVMLDNLSTELMGQAVIVAEVASTRADIWTDPSRAQLFVALVDSNVTTRIMLLDLNGDLLCSSDPSDVDLVGQHGNMVGGAGARAGTASVHTTYSRYLQQEVVDVLVPVIGPDQQVMGVVRMSHRLFSVYERFLRLRYLIAGVLAGGLVLGAVAGWAVAVNLEKPLRQVTQAVSQLTSGERTEPLPEQGPREVRSLSRAVNALVEQLHSMEQARRKLLSNLVHELGRPLGAFHSAIQALVGGAADDPPLRHDLLAGMADEVGRMRRLLDDLAALHDQVLGSLELDRRQTELRPWLAHTLSPWRQVAQDKGLQWQMTIPASLPTVEIDPDRLGQALGNLLSNAIKYTPSGGTVTVQAGIEAQQLWVRVSDTGPGIASEDLERVFTPFYRPRPRGPQPDRRFADGMGLGLSIAHDLVVAHGGRLQAESTPGLGSRFTVWLPLPPSQ